MLGDGAIGKSNCQYSDLSCTARRYANRDIAEPLIEKHRDLDKKTRTEILAALSRSRAVFYTPQILETVRHLKETMGQLIGRVEGFIDDHLHRGKKGYRDFDSDGFVELLIFDEAERLSITALELIRDIFDRTGVDLVLVGMPGMEKRLSHYPQFYSRVGFAHQYQPLADDELMFVLTRHWHSFGLDLNITDFTDAQAISSIVRLTGGNFRLLHRLFVQIEHIMKINELTVVTNDVVEAARSTLVVGVT